MGDRSGTTCRSGPKGPILFLMTFLWRSLRWPCIPAVLLLIFLSAASLGAQTSVAPPTEAAGFAGGNLHLYPLGWSSEGRWGTLVGRWGASGDNGVRLIVIDAVTDETLFRSRPMEWTGPDDFSGFWARFGRSISEKVDEYDLESDRKADVRDPLFITGGVSYEFVMTPASPAKGAYTLRITSSRGDSKDVFRSPASAVPDRSVLLGALVSPFEARGLAVIREEPADSAGLPSYRFSGAHLTLGFRSASSGGSAGSGSSGWTATVPSPYGSLISAVFNGQEYLVRSRLKAGADPDSIDPRGYTALLLAARLGHWTMVSDLLSAGASPDAKDSSGRTALHYAAFSGNAVAVRALLNAGADRSVRDGSGNIPAELAADPEVKNLFRSKSPKFPVLSKVWDTQQPMVLRCIIRA